MQRIIIIGATSGIGKTLATTYAGMDNLVGITGRRNEILLQMEHEHPNMRAACFDITEAGVEAHLQQLVKTLGGLDLLIISAGGGQPNESLDKSIDDDMTRLNVIAFLAIAIWSFHFFKQQGYGHLAVISSIAAYRGNKVSPAYSAAKAFQSRYMEGLAIRTYRSRLPIYTSTIEPGFVKTRQMQGKVFWVVPLPKAVRQIINGLQQKQRVIIVSRRWNLVAWLMQLLPFVFYKRI